MSGESGSRGPSPEPAPPTGVPPSDDTAAFRRFYYDDVPPAHGIVYRLLVGWWRRTG